MKSNRERLGHHGQLERHVRRNSHELNCADAHLSTRCKDQKWPQSLGLCLRSHPKMPRIKVRKAATGLPGAHEGAAFTEVLLSYHVRTRLPSAWAAVGKGSWPLMDIFDPRYGQLGTTATRSPTAHPGHLLASAMTPALHAQMYGFTSMTGFSCRPISIQELARGPYTSALVF